MYYYLAILEFDEFSAFWIAAQDQAPSYLSTEIFYNLTARYNIVLI
jgi:hypothetical protein